MLDHAEVVADEEIGEPEVAAQLHEEIQDLRLDRHVERGDGLVAYQELGLHGERARNADSASLPAGELVRVTRLVARVEPAAHEELVEVAVELLALHDAVHERRLAHDIGHPHARVERGERVLKDHLDRAPCLASRSLSAVASFPR